MTSAESKHIIWGYICAIDFAFLFIMSASYVIAQQKKNKDDENNSENL